MIHYSKKIRYSILYNTIGYNIIWYRKSQYLYLLNHNLTMITQSRSYMHIVFHIGRDIHLSYTTLERLVLPTSDDDTVSVSLWVMLHHVKQKFLPCGHPV